MERSATAQVQDAVERSITRGLTAVAPHAVDCVSMDKERFIGAFSMKLGTEELSDILLSMTDFSKATLSGNLKKLGYVDASQPKSNRIYPHDFEAKDAVIAFSLVVSSMADRIHREGHARVLMGGIHATAMPEEAIQHADQVLTGEGEKIILDEVEGRRIEKIVVGKPIQDLDRVPFPDYSISPLQGG